MIASEKLYPVKNERAFAASLAIVPQDIDRDNTEQEIDLKSMVSTLPVRSQVNDTLLAMGWM